MPVYRASFKPMSLAALVQLSVIALVQLKAAHDGIPVAIMASRRRALARKRRVLSAPPTRANG